MNESIAEQRAEQAGDDGSTWTEEIEAIFSQGAQIEHRVGPQTTWTYSDGSIILRQHGFGWNVVDLLDFVQLGEVES